MDILKKFSWSYISLELYEDHVSFVYPKKKQDIAFDSVTSITFFEGNFFKNPTIIFSGAGLIHTEYSAIAGLITINDGELTVPLKEREPLRLFFEAADKQWKAYKQGTIGNGGKSNVDDILRWKELLDAGAITQAEYDAKKKQLLGI